MVFLVSKKPNLEVSFPLICFQRLSRMSVATRQCRWYDNRYTRGSPLQVLSYYEEIFSSFRGHSRLGPTICYFANHIYLQLCSVAPYRVVGSAYRYVPTLLFISHWKSELRFLNFGAVRTISYRRASPLLGTSITRIHSNLSRIITRMIRAMIRDFDSRDICVIISAEQ